MKTILGSTMKNEVNLDTPARIVITGATSGLGTVISQNLAAMGYQLFLLGRNTEKLKALAQSLPGEHVIGWVDLMEPDSLTTLINENALEHGCFSGGVYCAGLHEMATIRSSNYEALERLFRVNCGGASALIKAFTKKKTRNKVHSSLVLISSVTQLVGEAGISGYATSKAALGGLARCAALELAKDKVKINCIAAGMIRTPLNAEYEDLAPEGYFDLLESLHPIGFGQPEDVAEAVEFLLRNKWTTGSTLSIDGGYTCR
jgi:NAD(P)-dependent dehydrogenase (short-subunit alcohol dehydrogenase family)